MVRESNQNVFLIEKDAEIFAEFEISEFEISRVDCMYKTSKKVFSIQLNYKKWKPRIFIIKSKI